MEPVRLERLRRRHTPALVAMAQEFRDEGDPRLDLMLDDPESYFADVDRFEKGEDLGPNLVKQSQFLLFGGERLLGAARVRHRLNDKLQLDGGNIGYEIRPPERGKGYGSAILRLILLEARRIGLDRVLLTAAVAADEELSFDYLINNPAGDSWPCACGARRCRGETGSSFFTLPAAFQHEYRPLLADWFVRRYPLEIERLDSGD